MAYSQNKQALNLVSTWAVLVNSKVVAPGKSELYLEVNRHFLLECLWPYIAKIRVDEEWYLGRYADVKKAIDDGLIRRGKEHYVRYGYMENRLPYQINVDEGWYLTRYTDVKNGIEKGSWKSAQHHFDAVGYSEGRFPFQNFTLDRSDEE